MKNTWGPLAAVCMVVIGTYAYMAQSGRLEMLSPNAADTYYNLLVRGFRAGHLSLQKEVPPWLSRLADPYDPLTHPTYPDPLSRTSDLSYYHGRFYLYFGITPALILFWPFVALTGHYLWHSQAVVIFCAVGFLISVGLLGALWRRYFAEVNVSVVAACAVALGLATGVPVLLSRTDVYEVAISCGYMLTMLALAAIWCAWHEPERRCRWLAAASLAYGLAVGARPSLLFGVVILLVPVAQSWREPWSRKLSGLMAVTGPILLIGLGLMLYNFLRFENPFEFGQHYQLNAEHMVPSKFFSLHYLWFNLRVYFLGSARWSARFPFVDEIPVPPPPPGHGGGVEGPLGILMNIPLVWLALAVPLACRRHAGQTTSILRWFVVAVAMFFGSCVLTLGLYWWVNFRYEVEFLPALLLLAVLGILGLERAVAERPVWRRAVRLGWGLLLVFSVAFNLLASGEYYAQAHNSLGSQLFDAGRFSEAVGQYQQALRIDPDYAEAHGKLGIALVRLGRLPEAIEQYQQALRINPDDAATHYNLGTILEQQGKAPEAIKQYEQALRIKPDLAEAHYNLGTALEQTGDAAEAAEHYRQALQIKPDYAEAYNNLGVMFGQAGRIEEAINYLEQAVRSQPNFVEAHNNLGNALKQAGRFQAAIEQYEEAVRFKPDYAEAHYNLGIVLARAGNVPGAIAHYEQALRIKPDFIEARNALARLQPAR